ncbi:glycosyltransferase family A protein [uncultured Cetobacterium sp.]|uniref:glycosyltransferase family 2 protein n=1 Tax=uncultured Cetobacterium sp. TaxID=527638 RepID=UPI00261C62D5|nr:glycosyltransferase family A protein [uncultured Cetobacterium sp.]
MKVSIVTATYNRGEKLAVLYESLKKQKLDLYKWIIIDDGSTDNTEKIIKELKKENKVEIYYYKKVNGGKHTAINFCLDNCVELTELIFFVDSDDFLKEDAIEQIIFHYNSLKNKEKYAGLCFQKIEEKTNKFLEKNFPYEEFDSTVITSMRRYKLHRDKAEVFFKSELIKHRFPVIKGEKFFSELYIWMDLTKEKKIRYINKGIYVCSYNDDGYTKNMKSIIKKNPVGNLLYYTKIYKTKSIGIEFRLRALYRILYILIEIGKKDE